MMLRHDRLGIERNDEASDFGFLHLKVEIPSLGPCQVESDWLPDSCASLVAWANFKVFHVIIMVHGQTAQPLSYMSHVIVFTRDMMNSTGPHVSNPSANFASEHE